jgi:hypothetical protein
MIAWTGIVDDLFIDRVWARVLHGHVRACVSLPLLLGEGFNWGR